MRKKRDGRCEWCEGPGPLQRHHLTYKRKGRELREDCVYICNLCHGAEHPACKYLPNARDRKQLSKNIVAAKRRSYARLGAAEKRLRNGTYRKRRKLSRKEKTDIMVEKLVRRGWKRVG